MGADWAQWSEQDLARANKQHKWIQLAHSEWLKFVASKQRSSSTWLSFVRSLACCLFIVGPFGSISKLALASFVCCWCTKLTAKFALSLSLCFVRTLFAWPTTKRATSFSFPFSLLSLFFFFAFFAFYRAIVLAKHVCAGQTLAPTNREQASSCSESSVCISVKVGCHMFCRCSQNSLKE